MIVLEKNLINLQIYQLIDLTICDTLINKISYFRKNKLFELIGDNTNTFTLGHQSSDTIGFQTSNLLLSDDFDIINFSVQIRYEISKIISVDQQDLEYVFLHFLDYDKHGHIVEHDHKDKEDLTFLLYLNDCSDGETEFYLNNANSLAKLRTSIRIKPKKGRLALFSSTVPHKGMPTTQYKKIFAGGLKYNIKNENSHN